MTEEYRDTTGQHLSRTDAERLTQRITLRLQTIADNVEAVVPMIEEARAREAWKPLGYDSWTGYVTDRFSGLLGRLTAAERKPIVGMLADQGMSTRAIAPIVGASQKTVSRDLAGESPDSPREVTGLDGKTYTTRSRPPCELCGRPYADHTPEETSDHSLQLWQQNQEQEARLRQEQEEWEALFTATTPCPGCRRPLEWSSVPSDGCPWPHIGKFDNTSGPLWWDDPAVHFRDLITCGVDPDAAYAVTHPDDHSRPQPTDGPMLEAAKTLSPIVRRAREALHEAEERVVNEPPENWHEGDWQVRGPKLTAAVEEAGGFRQWADSLHGGSPQ